LTNSLPWVFMVLSHVGGFEDCCAHTRTVKSRDADTTEAGEGKATLRTYRGLVLLLLLQLWKERVKVTEHNRLHLHRLRGRAKWRIV
jgi:hypothetical protein